VRSLWAASDRGRGIVAGRSTSSLDGIKNGDTATDLASGNFEDTMAIDIDRLTEAELIDLNNRIVERLSQARAHGCMLQFKIGDRVSFEPEGRGVIFGILARYNKKSVTVISEAGERWTVAPQFLRLVVQTEGEVVRDANVVPMRKK
jgi:hypothetical protein